MVSFSCEACGDVLTKKKLDPHRSRCREATFTCIDCMVHFRGFDYRSHTSCITEDQKYQGALYKEKSSKTNPKPAQQPEDSSPLNNMARQPSVEEAKRADSKPSAAEVSSRKKRADTAKAMAPQAEPSPSATVGEHVNVFDFLVASGQTPNGSDINLTRSQLDTEAGKGKHRHRPENYLELSSALFDGKEPLVQYGSGPIPVDSYTTPAPKSHRRKTKDGEAKKDKKRKQLHADAPRDHIMTDAPPLLHSGLTGGLKSLMRPTLPPSPDYSGGDAADNSPPSPLKKTKHVKQSKHSKHSKSGSSIFDVLTGGSKAKREAKKSAKESGRHKERHGTQLIELRSPSKEKRRSEPEGQVVVYKPHADAFLGSITKGPESERGCSMNKALRRYHRDRRGSSSGAAKGKEEKELWRTLRLRRNDRGEIVLFTL